MNTHTHDPLSLMSREESLMLGQWRTEESGDHTFETASLDGPVKIRFGYDVVSEGKVRSYVVTSYERIENGISPWEWMEMGESTREEWMKEEIELLLTDMWGADVVKFGAFTMLSEQDAAAESALAAVISGPRLEKLKWSLALMYIKMDASDADFLWLSNRVEGAMKLNADPNRLPF